jgi:hypothetical protein
MDGLLRFITEGRNPKHKAERASIVETMDSEIRHIFEKLRKSLSPLGTWEMKSTSAGPHEVMAAVLNLGKFHWTRCSDEDCLVSMKHQKEQEKVDHTVAGPDAQNPP